MSQAEIAIREKSSDSTPECVSLNGARASGFVLKPIDVPAAIALLNSFYEEDEQEQRETWELLELALTQHRP